MFTNTSWLEYLVFVTIVLIVYYLYVGLKFYSQQLRLILSGKRKLFTATEHNNLQPEDTYDNAPLLQGEEQQELFVSEKKYASSIKEIDDTFQKAEELAALLQESIAYAASKNYIKEEFILSIQLLLKKYHVLKGTPYLVDVNNLIASECEKHGYILLNAEELVMLWE